MSGLFNRLKTRKTTTPTSTHHHENETPTTSTVSFDEEGFLCPSCHHKFNDHNQLALHYTEVHTHESVKDTPSIHSDDIQQDPSTEVALWKQQFTISEESRIILSNELMHEKQRANDLEEELQLIQKHLKATQAKVAEQSQEIANLKATKDVYDAQLTICTNELLQTQDRLKEKEQEVINLSNSLMSKLNNDDIEMFKTELISRDQQIESLTLALIENYKYTQRLDQLENLLNNNLSNYNEIMSKNTLQIESGINQIKQFVKLTRQQKEKIVTIVKDMHHRLTQNQIQIEQLQQTNNQLNSDLEQQKQVNEKLINGFDKQKNSSRNQIDLLNNEIVQLEKSLNELKQEKNQLIQCKIDDDHDDQRQNILRQITAEKDQYEQQTKELRLQIKQLTNELKEIQDKFKQISEQSLQITDEKNQLQTEQIQLQRNNKNKEQEINKLRQELSNLRERYTSVENNLREANENNDNQKRETESIKNDFLQQINRLEQEKTDLQKNLNQQEQLATKTLIQLNTLEKEKDNLVQQLQTTLSQLHARLDKRERHIQRLLIGIRRTINLTHKIQEYIQKHIQPHQINLLTIIEKTAQDSQSNRTKTFEEIREEFTNYLTTVYRIIIDSKTKLDKQIEDDHLNFLEQQKQMDKIKHEYEQLLKEHDEQKQKSEKQIAELSKKLAQVTESLTESTQTVNRQREKYEKQIASLERELDSRTKRHEMQLSALTENLATVRTELKLTNEKLATIDQLKAEKNDIEARLAVSQDERRVLLERSLASESKNEKLIAENAQLLKKSSESDSALLEIAREYQVLQIQTNKLSQRRWIDDDDVDACMKCNHTFSVTQRKHHCRNCGNIFCDNCSSKTATIASSKKQKRVCEQCYKELTS